MKLVQYVRSISLLAIIAMTVIGCGKSNEDQNQQNAVGAPGVIGQPGIVGSPMIPTVPTNGCYYVNGQCITQAPNMNSMQCPAGTSPSGYGCVPASGCPSGLTWTWDQTYYGHCYGQVSGISSYNFNPNIYSGYYCYYQQSLGQYYLRCYVTNSQMSNNGYVYNGYSWFKFSTSKYYLQ